MEKPKVPLSQLVFGETVYWICVLTAIICMIGPVISLMNIDNNIMNPHYLFACIFEGNNAETVWNKVAGGFPGGHFWIANLSAGDGFTQFGVVVGCACAFPALLATAVVFLLKKNERSILWALVSIGIAALISVSALGVVNA